MSLQLTNPQSLLRTPPAAKLPPIDRSTSDAIIDIVRDACFWVVGDEVIEAISPATPEQLYVLAPWAFDLALGLHYRSVRGAIQPKAAELIVLFADTPPTAQFAEFERFLDVAFALTLDQTIDHIHGPGATMRPPEQLRDATPWLDTCILGARLRLASELVRHLGI